MKLLISMIVGGTIGYFTNWLAIKMLFRPYEAKYFLGYQIPFTPGLIPKEQKRIAKSVGHTVEEYLLSPEEVLRYLDEKSLDEKIKKQIKEILIKSENYKIKDILLKLNLLKSVESYSCKIVEQGIEGFKKNSHGKDKELYFTLKDIVLLESRLEIESFMQSEDFNLLITNYIEGMENKLGEKDNKLRDYISKDSIESIERLIEENQRYITYKLRTLLEKEEVREKLKKLIGNLVEENVSGLLTGLIGIDNISNKIIDGLYEYMRSNKAVGDIKSLLDLGIEEILNLPVKIVYQIGSELISVDSIENVILKVLESKETESLNVGRNIIDRVLSNREFLMIIDDYRIEILNKLYEINIGKTLKESGIDEIEIMNIIERCYKSKIQEKLPNLIKRMEIGKIVEKSILDFEFDFVEKLVLDIAEKELKAITKLGGVLGAIIGIVTPFLQAI